MSGSTDCVVFDIKKYAIHDGPGIRTTIFFKGCPLSCAWCHNPEGIALSSSMIHDMKRCIGCLACVEACPEEAISVREKSDSTGSAAIHTDRTLCSRCGICADICPTKAREEVGRSYSLNKIMEMIEKDIPFYENSGGGVTFSGGEPLMQWEPLVELLKGCRDLEIHRAVDTTGFAPWPVLEKVAQVTDLFLFDLKHMDGALHKLHTGVSNALILSNLRNLAMRGSAINIRIPMIPGVNDDDANIEATGNFLADLGRESKGVSGIKEITLLPYHDFQRSKYIKFGIDYRADNILPPTEERVKEVQYLLQGFGVKVVVG